jgi:hypothetical protein
MDLRESFFLGSRRSKPRGTNGELVSSRDHEGEEPRAREDPIVLTALKVHCRCCTHELSVDILSKSPVQAEMQNSISEVLSSESAAISSASCWNGRLMRGIRLLSFLFDLYHAGAHSSPWQLLLGGQFDIEQCELFCGS